jgi:transposase-like protein
MVYLWRAVDHEDEALDSRVTRSRDKMVELAFMKKALKRHGTHGIITTDGLRSYGTAIKFARMHANAHSHFSQDRHLVYLRGLAGYRSSPARLPSPKIDMHHVETGSQQIDSTPHRVR